MPSPESATSLLPVFSPDGRIQIGSDTIALTETRATVLQALVERGSATLSQLRSDSGFSNANKILRDIRHAHPVLQPYIKMAGRKSAGGYSTTIVLAK
jgi:hypothetical protein